MKTDTNAGPFRLGVEPGMSIQEVTAAQRAGRTTAAELVESCLKQIDLWEPRIQAWVSVDREGSRQRAAELDRARVAGQPLGPLHGVPLGIKDIVDMAGFPTSAGSSTFALRPAEADATIVKKLRAAGAILIGKTVTTQFASFDPPVTRNPWNLAHTPGGSSSGSAAAVAAGMCFGAIGSQTGGSITRPAAFCGVAGVKPTYGRVSLQGLVPLASSMDHPGVLARSTEDLALLLDLLAGPDPADPNCATVALPEIMSTLARRPPAAPRLGRLRGMFDRRADLPALAVLEDGLEVWARAEAKVSDIEPQCDYDAMLINHRQVMASEAAAFHEPRLAQHRADYQPRILSLIEEGSTVPVTEYIRARQAQAAARAQVLAEWGDNDVLICLSATGPAPPADTTGDPAFNSPWSFTGLPSVCFPLTLINGLPVGVQLIGRPFGEAELFRAAVWCEKVWRAV